ncbi:MAG: hypothetical protein H0W83_04685 [Planctomycetes bacterium]|nr:hypothetical protein [Planctomycetota bacterium]
MCERCDAYAETIRIASPGDLDAQLARAHAGVDEGALEAMDDDRALSQRLPGAPLPKARPVKGTWVCTQCSRLFLLELNSCHLVGDGWRPLFGN